MPPLKDWRLISIDYLDLAFDLFNDVAGFALKIHRAVLEDVHYESVGKRDLHGPDCSRSGRCCSGIRVRNVLRQALWVAAGDCHESLLH